MQLGKYEIGRTLGEGNFGKVKYARHVETGQAVAVKILDRKRIQSLKVDDQVGRPFLGTNFCFLFFLPFSTPRRRRIWMRNMNWAFSEIRADKEGDWNAEAVEASERRPII